MRLRDFCWLKEEREGKKGSVSWEKGKKSAGVVAVFDGVA